MSKNTATEIAATATAMAMATVSTVTATETTTASQLSSSEVVVAAAVAAATMGRNQRITSKGTMKKRTIILPSTGAVLMTTSKAASISKTIATGIDQ